jgi:addiction module RelE/StbE family toxin
VTIWTRRALRHIDDIAAYLAQEAEEVADRILRRIQEAVSHLEDHPVLGRVGRIAGTRELVVSHTPYFVVYRIRHGDVHILAVLHIARRWPTRL